MSGTSLDGVDGVLVPIPKHYSGGPLPILATTHIPFSPEMRKELMALQAVTENEIERSAIAANQLAHLYAQCVFHLLEKSNISSDAVTAIGVHGQTIRHRPELGFTWQINNPALLAELTRIDVIADFRSRDIAAKGQGAPLVPAFHRAVFGNQHETQVVINIGGISNISILNANNHTHGFDTGPGNILMDAWIAHHNGLNYDDNGNWAASGEPSMDLLASMLEEPFFKLAPPKSTGRDLFQLDWLKTKLDTFLTLKPADVQATLATLTATTIADAIKQYAPLASKIYVCGGGAKNTHLINQLQNTLNQIMHTAPAIDTTDALNIESQYVEALAFAWLAHCFLQKQPGNLPEVTGAKGLRILGALYPGS